MKTSGNAWRVEIGDCRLKMQEIEAESIDAVVVDPPYGISFMDKEFDKLGDPQQQQEFHRQWAVEAFRVLKPGGHIICFAGARTYHRVAAGIEDAGFVIRDQLLWLYGSGFPKSANPSRKIDEAAGATPKVIGIGKRSTSRGMQFEKGSGEWGHGFNEEYEITEPVTEQAQRFRGWGSNLKPAHEPMVLARKPYKGALHENMIEHGTGGLNVGACRVGDEVRTSKQIDGGNLWGRRGEKTVPHKHKADKDATIGAEHVGRWPANVILSGDAPERLDAAATEPEPSRFFKQIEYDEPFIYTPKASRADRGKGNNHPTVKPQKLMTYLIELVAERGATILDPFCGSGSTGVAAVRAGYRFIGIEKDEEYAEIACRRIGAPMQATILF